MSQDHLVPTFFNGELKKERGGVIGKHLRQLPYDDKARLIADLIINSEAESEVTKKVIAHICQPPDELPEQKKVALDQKAVLLLQYAACLIPDVKMPIREKVKLCEQVCVQLKIEPELLTKSGLDFRYVEPLEPLKVNQYSGNIDIHRYRTAISVSNLDYSDFILLTLGVIQVVCKDKDSEILLLLKSVRKLYFSREYEKAIQALQHLVGTHVKSSHPELAKIILDKSNSGLREVTLSENYSRRFYENRLMQFYLGQSIDWAGIYRVASGIAPLFSEVRDMDSRYPHVKLRSIFSSMSYFLKYDLDTLNEKVSQLKTNSIPYQHRKRVRQKKHSTVFGSNKGVMLASQLNFYPEIARHVQRDRVVDKLFFESKDTRLPFGSRTVFAGALSGSTFDIIPTLEMYIKEKTDRSTLDADLNNFIKGLMCDFVNRGYHSIYEVIDVFTQSDVKKILDDNHVKLDLSWTDAQLEHASRDAQAYAEAVCLNRVKNEELRLLSDDTLIEKLQSPEHKDFLNVIPAKFKKIVIYRLLRNTIEENHIDNFARLFFLAPDLINLRDFISALNENPTLVVNSLVASNYNLVTKLLSEVPEMIDRQNYAGNTLLHYAVHVKDLANAQLLLDKGARIDIPGQDGFFSFAESICDETDEKAVERNYTMLRMFMQRVNAEEKHSAEMLHAMVNIPGTKATVFYVFALRCSVKILKSFLKAYPEITDINSEDERRRTPFTLSYCKYAGEGNLAIKKKYLEMMMIFATHEVNHSSKKFNDKDTIAFLLERKAYEVIFMIVLRAKMINPTVLEKVDYKKLIDEFREYLNKLASTQSRLKLVHMMMNSASPLGQVLRNKNVEPFIIEKSLQAIFKQDKQNVSIAKQMITLALPHAQSAKELKKYLKIYEPDVLNLILNTLQAMRSAESKSQSSSMCFAWDRSKLLLLQSEIKKLLSPVRQECLVRAPLKLLSQTPALIRSR